MAHDQLGELVIRWQTRRADLLGEMRGFPSWLLGVRRRVELLYLHEYFRFRSCILPRLLSFSMHVAVFPRAKLAGVGSLPAPLLVRLASKYGRRVLQYYKYTSLFMRSL
jgi:hypothetical protein